MKYKLTIPEPPPGTKSYVEFGDFSDDLWNLLTLFMSYSGEAHRTRFARELIDYKPSFRLPNTGKVCGEGIIPDDEALSAFLHKYRPIILPGEPTEFNQVCSHLIRHISDQGFTRLVGQWKELYSGKILRGCMSFKQGDLDLLGESFLQQYLNAYEYHRDPKKRERLLTFSNTFDQDAKKGLVTLLLKLKFGAVSNLRKFIHDIRTQKEGK